MMFTSFPGSNKKHEFCASGLVQPRHCARLIISVCGTRQMQMDIEMLDALSDPLEDSNQISGDSRGYSWSWSVLFVDDFCANF